MKTIVSKNIFFLIAALVCFESAADTLAKNKAARIFQRLAYYKLSLASETVQQQMINLVMKGDRDSLLQAAAIATAERTFYEENLYRWAMKKTNPEQSPHGDFSDLVAMVIGHTRDNGDYRELFFGNFTYIANPGIPRDSDTDPQNGVRAHSAENNNHYLDLGARRNILAELVRASNVFPNGVRLSRGQNNSTPFHTFPEEDAAGMLTSYALTRIGLSAGTNRRIIKLIFELFFEMTLDDIADPLASDHWVARDVDRFPGGDINLYKTTCRKCHARVVDPFRGAYARMNFFGNEFHHRQTNVWGKYNVNGTIFDGGHVTTDNSWENVSRSGPINWDPTKPMSGKGARSLGMMLAYSDRLPVATAINVFKHVCHREPSEEEAPVISSVASRFVSSNFNLRRLFEEVAILTECTGI